METERPSIMQRQHTDWKFDGLSIKCCDRLAIGRANQKWAKNYQNSLHWPPPGQNISGSVRVSQANLGLAKKNRSALSLSSVEGKGVSCLWIRFLVFITSSCAGTEDSHTIPYPVLSVSGPSHLSHSSPVHQRALALEGTMEKHTGLIARYPNRSMGLVLKWERKCKAVQNSSHVSESLPNLTLLILNVQIRKQKFFYTPQT